MKFKIPGWALLLPCVVGGASPARGAVVAPVSFNLAKVDGAGSPAAALPWEMSIWGGHSEIECTTRCESFQRLSRTGLRSLELAVWPVKEVRLSARYDETLYNNDEPIPAYWVGALVEHGGRYLTNVNIGYRELPGGIRQPMVQAEQVVFLPGAVNLGKAGGWVGARSDGRTEWLGYGGLGVRVTERIKFEPTLFHSRSGVPHEKDTRLLLFTEYAKPGAWTLGVGAALGQASIVRTGQIENEPVWDSFLLASTRIQGQALRLLLRHGQTRNLSRVTTLAIGLTVGRRP